MTRPIRSAAASPRLAGNELLVLAKWEEFLGWLLEHTAKWPKTVRFTLTQRVENHGLDIVEALVVARYVPRERGRILHDVNLLLERMRFLFRLARGRNVQSAAGFETTMRGLDEVGRMLHGWRTAEATRATPTPVASPPARSAPLPESSSLARTEPVSDPSSLARGAP